MEAEVVFVECRCPREIALDRLTRRWHARLEASQEHQIQYLSASDGRPELYQAQADAWEAPLLKKEIAHHVVIETTQPVNVSVEQILALLHIPRLACRLMAPM